MEEDKTPTASPTPPSNREVARWPRSARVLLRLAGGVFVVGTVLFVVGFLVGTRDVADLALGMILVGVPTVFLTLTFAGLAVVLSRERQAGVAGRAIALVIVGALCASIGLAGAAGNLPGVDAVSGTLTALFFALAAAAFYLGVR